MTIKHTVSFNLKDKSTPIKDNPISIQIKKDLEALKRKIDGLQHIEVGFNINPSERSADIILLSKFESLASLEEYRIHPDHVKIVQIIKEHCHELRVVDYDI